MKKWLIILLMLPTLVLAAGKTNPPWEQIKAPTGSVHMYRMSVPHGWLVHTLFGIGPSSPSTVFVPDENHEWVLDK